MVNYELPHCWSVRSVTTPARPGKRVLGSRPRSVGGVDFGISRRCLALMWQPATSVGCHQVGRMGHRLVGWSKNIQLICFFSQVGLKAKAWPWL